MFELIEDINDLNCPKLGAHQLMYSVAMYSDTRKWHAQTLFSVVDVALLISEMKRPVLAKFSIRGVLISDLLIIESAAVKKK